MRSCHVMKVVSGISINGEEGGGGSAVEGQTTKFLEKRQYGQK